jgi:predicted transcriptional regulator
MYKVPCESIVWNGLPVIRKEIAKSMINNFGLNQKEAAGKLGITPAAVCQYLSKKRGKVEILDRQVLNEIRKSADTIIHNNDYSITNEVCRICQILVKKGLFPAACESCNSKK